MLNPLIYSLLENTFRRKLQVFGAHHVSYLHTYVYKYIYTVGTESIQTPLNFSLFVILQPFAKII